MHGGGMDGFGAFFAVLFLLLVIALTALAVTATVWLIRNMNTRRPGATRADTGTTDSRS
ncbi:MAG: hypothetical protein M3457_17475 [Chloroflexota bacterium]|nr:hypothetical protein [Chloroflexota bacterium]